jgi:putative FmdB family regulatory protein
MPTYTYECKKCGKVFDVFHSISATPLVKCEDCGGATKRMIGTGAGIIFKGSGFYETDYKRSSAAGAGSSESKGGEGKSSESKSSEPKGSDAKSSDTKSSASKGSESKGSGKSEKRSDLKK